MILFDKNFLLSSKSAKTLYKYVKDMPIIDYHNHLSLGDICENKRYTDVYDLWIKPDPYKHRAMRMCGISEKYITGDASNEEKFIKWCAVLPSLVGNPLYHWSLMELRTVFNIKEMPNENNGKRLFDLCNTFLEKNEVSVKTLIEKFNIKIACPCASFTDDISKFGNRKTFVPSLRGDDAVEPSAEFIEKIGNLTDVKIENLVDFETALKVRLSQFEQCGCKVSDHALDNGFRFYKDDGKNSERFKTLLDDNITQEDKLKLSSYILTFLGKEYSRLNFTLQLHIGAQRYTSTKLREKVGPAGGFAGIGNSVDVNSLTLLLDTLDMSENGLPKTILFTLNPSDNALISVLSGSFSKENVSGLITQGPAWWWCDHKFCIEDMFENTAAFGVLSNFVGMTTDSRSFLSFVRHDYFRRILCNYLGEKYRSGEYDNFSLVKNIAKKMCYENANKIFKENDYV